MSCSLRKLVCECIGTFALTSTVIMTVATGSGATIVAAGAILAALAYAFGHVSGTHVNPAVSVGVFFSKCLIEGDCLNAIIEFIQYCVAQFVGASAAGAFCALVFRLSDLEYATVGVYPYRASSNSIFLDVATEGLAVFLFLTVILRTACSQYNKPQNAGIAIGLTLSAGLWICGSFTGGGMNPAVVTGIFLANHLSANHGDYAGSWMAFFVAYFAAPVIGSIFASFVHYYLEKSEDEDN